MSKHLAIKLTLLLLILLLLAIGAPMVLAQTASGRPNPVAQAATAATTTPDSDPAVGKISHQFKIRPAEGTNQEVDLGKVIMTQRNPYKVYTDPQLKLMWFRRDHEALAIDFKIKDNKDKEK